MRHRDQESLGKRTHVQTNAHLAPEVKVKGAKLKGISTEIGSQGEGVVACVENQIGEQEFPVEGLVRKTRRNDGYYQGGDG